MTPDLRQKLEALGPDLAPPMLQGTQALFAAMAAVPDKSLEITRDHHYGPDERNRLDIFRQPGTMGAPVLVFIHGGGFVMGDKSTPGSPFYDHIGQWAAQQGWVGVTMTYRLAPANNWPSGPQDLAHAIRWLKANVAQHGGNPDAIFMIGQSAGAAHLAGYVSHADQHPGGDIGLAGAMMISGIYDTVTCEPNPFHIAYYGEDTSLWEDARCNAGLMAASIPLMFTVSEFDPEDFQKQAAQIVAEWRAAKGSYAPMHWMDSHNHLSPILAIGSSADTLGPIVRRFVLAHAD